MAKKRARRRSEAWSERAASEILDEADRWPTDSGFCRDRGISPGRIAWWRNKLKRLRRHRSSPHSEAVRTGQRKRGPRAARNAGFVEVVGVRSAGVMEVRLRSGRELRVPLSADPDQVARFADALERC